ncbi:protein mono-ADP-ribosyltransferase PARP14-like [Dendronephthya gigantea]|uniref:protein mono-ADP-ribosyltransferase PARP14-like n=1 Tax=Dendronephthya gigantea TaxID=151771 RepID=UPI00106B6FA9|nr:protein mono-ADP-ribosyltransferase PARP14-like [Dendronephthya gigantea]
MFFESHKRSGGGDIEKLERCKPDVVYITFKSAEVAERILNRDNLEISGYRLQLARKRTELSPLLKKHEEEEAYLGEVRTVVVNGISEIKDEVLEMFFESNKRSGGGEIEKLERCGPNVAHITFKTAEVASRVLEQADKMKLDGYILQVEEKQPELFLPVDRKKIYVENLNPKTTEDSLRNYIELRAKADVCEIEFGENRNALLTFNITPDFKNFSLNNRRLEGAELKFSNPPVCNSVLVTGLTKKTTKDTIEMFFENERNGGGKIYGDIIYQKDKGIAVVSFCNPRVVQTLRTKEQKLDDSVLSLRPYYSFMETVKETTTKTVKLSTDVVDHVLKNCNEEFRKLFGADILRTFKEITGELTVSADVANEIEKYITQFAVKDIVICAKLLEKSNEELGMKIANVQEKRITVVLDEEQLQIKLIGKKEVVYEIYEQFKHDITEMEKRLEVVTEQINLPGPKLELLLLHGVGEMLENDFQVEVKTEPLRSLVTLKGKQNQVSLASKEVYMKVMQIHEDNIDINAMKVRFLRSGGIDVLNNEMKRIGLKGLISLDSKLTKAKILVFDKADIENIHSFVNSIMFEKQYQLDDDSLTLLRSNKWKEFQENITTNKSVVLCTDETSPNEITLIGEKKEVKETYESLQKFMKQNTIVKHDIELDKGYAGYLSKYCTGDLNEVEKKLEDLSVRVVLEDEGVINIVGTKDGVEEAKRQLNEIVSNIEKGTIIFDRPRMQDYLKSEAGKIFISGIQTRHKCFTVLKNDDEEEYFAVPLSRPVSELLCSHDTQEKITLKVYKGDITAHCCDVIVNAANGDLNHIGGLAKSITVAGGKEIQEECDAYVKAEGRLYEGECFSGSPGKLPCKRIIHAVGPRWDARNPEKTCRTLSFTCTKVLEEARGYRSIAFPAIGSGIYEIPKEICADLMIDAAEKFSKTSNKSNLKEIHFVDNDEESCRAFVRKFREKFGTRSSIIKTNERVVGTRSRVALSATKSMIQENEREEPDIASELLPKQKNDNFIITKSNMKIFVAVGDLSTYKADVLVNTTGENLNLDSNPCSRALSNEAGPTLQAECRKIGKLKLGEVAVTKAGNLLCDEVYHSVCVQWGEGQGEEVLRSIIKNCLKKCHSSGKTSIAFPAIGTGILGFPHDVAAKIFFEETKEFEQSVSNCSIKEVSFVVYSQDAKSIEAFKNALKKQTEWDSSGIVTPVPVPVPTPRKRGIIKRTLKSKSTSISKPSQLERPSDDENEEEEPSVLKRAWNYLWKSESTTKEKSAITTKKLLLDIYAKDENTVKRAKEDIMKIMESQKKKESIEDDIIGKLSQQEISDIKYLGERAEVRITVNKELNRILVAGHSDDVSKMNFEIMRILTGIRDAEKEKEKAALQDEVAEMVSQGVQWYSVDPTSDDLEEYDKHTNAMIEKAYSKQEKSVIFFDDEKYEIVFKQMQETNLAKNETKKVIRKDLKVTVPEYWDPQPCDASGKEIGVHLVCLDPNNPSHKDEYKKVYDLFDKTAANQNIVQIDRIQNPSLYKLYFIKKRSLDEKNGSNEMLLFHGTKGDKLNEINESGLNRNYAGINGTAFGKGVYFARDASMSSGYTQPDQTSGKKYMYLARVAVGQFTKGEQSLLVPPPKAGKGNESYDSVVNEVTNPTIYVMFYDNQYYPEYLITFT